jgi:hypothetical protein
MMFHYVGIGPIWLPITKLVLSHITLEKKKEFVNANSGTKET